MNRPDRNEPADLLLSQLADGELSADAAARVLLETLDDEDRRRRLKHMLRLRQSLLPWRAQTPPVDSLPPATPATHSARPGHRTLALAVAALLGGVLVAGGFYLGTHYSRAGNDATAAGHSGKSDASPDKTQHQEPAAVLIATPQQRREIARAFALHESVAGPLSWYAADDSTIELGATENKEDLRQPIAVLLRLAPQGSCRQGEAKTYVIVCRSDESATIELPQATAGRAVSLRLCSTIVGGQVSLRYAIAAGQPDAAPDQQAVLAGGRQIGLTQTPLGQLALGDCLVNVDAGGWPIERESAP